ncbi:MAG TPA: PadR family transcriptional regulator [Acidimicrobiales bacterium]|jgi:DNA-binding PadR family transcriptional regulator|nr:PadR family transcriptional regulator [Acidimicrobiales bacterium]
MTPTAWAVLGLLSFGRELSGYDLKKWADNSLRFFYWSPAASQIYSELRRLEKLGYATSTVARQDDLRNKRVYSITETGRQALEAWLREPPEPTVLKHPTMLRVWLGHVEQPDRLTKVLDAHRADLTEQLDAARHAAEHATDDPAWGVHPAAVTRWAVRRLESELDLLDELERDLATIPDPRKRFKK